MFENRKVNDVYETRYIISWLRSGGGLRYGEDYDEFREWLISLKLDTESINHIMFMAMNGKLELETSAKKFITSIRR